MKPPEMTDWARVRRAVEAMNAHVLTAEAEEEFQAVGLLAREVLISVGQSVYDAGRHGAVDGIEPSPTDAKRMLEAYIAMELSGPGNEEARRFVRSAVGLADALQHRRSARRTDCELVAAAVESVVRMIELLDGHAPSRDPWQGVELQERYFAWAGPSLHALDDRQPVPTPPDLPDALRRVGMIPSYGLRRRLNHHLAQGGFQVFETDRQRWRRELLYASDGDQVLLAKPGNG
jgi:hypothetical protein